MLHDNARTRILQYVHRVSRVLGLSQSMLLSGLNAWLSLTSTPMACIALGQAASNTVMVAVTVMNGILHFHLIPREHAATEV